MTQEAIVYVRATTEIPAALERQTAACREFARSNRYTIIGKYAEVGSGQAAYLPLREQAIERAAADHAALVCQQPDRLTCSMAGLETILAECERSGVCVQFANPVCRASHARGELTCDHTGNSLCPGEHR